MFVTAAVQRLIGDLSKAEDIGKTVLVKVNVLKLRKVAACCPASPLRLTLKDMSVPFWKLKKSASVPREWNENTGPLA